MVQEKMTSDQILDTLFTYHFEEFVEWAARTLGWEIVWDDDEDTFVVRREKWLGKGMGDS